MIARIRSLRSRSDISPTAFSGLPQSPQNWLPSGLGLLQCGHCIDAITSKAGRLRGAPAFQSLAWLRGRDTLNGADCNSLRDLPARKNVYTFRNPSIFRGEFLVILSV